MARPRRTFTDDERRQVRALAKAQVPHRDIALCLGTSIDTLERRCRAELDRGAAEGRAAVLVRQYQRAVDGHPTAMIWWGKQYLGQRDRFEHTGAEGGALIPPVTTQRTQVLVVLPDNGRARGLEPVSLIDVVHKYGLYPVRRSEADEAAQGGGPGRASATPVTSSPD